MPPIVEMLNVPSFPPKHEVGVVITFRNEIGGGSLIGIEIESLQLLSSVTVEVMELLILLFQVERHHMI